MCMFGVQPSDNTHRTTCWWLCCIKELKLILFYSPSDVKWSIHEPFSLTADNKVSNDSKRDRRRWCQCSASACEQGFQITVVILVQSSHHAALTDLCVEEEEEGDEVRVGLNSTMLLHTLQHIQSARRAREHEAVIKGVILRPRLWLDVQTQPTVWLCCEQRDGLKSTRSHWISGLHMVL